MPFGALVRNRTFITDIPSQCLTIKLQEQKETLHRVRVWKLGVAVYSTPTKLLKSITITHYSLKHDAFWSELIQVSG
jgi:hypothetical protein